MHNPAGFGSGNLLSRPFGGLSQCIIEMELDISKRLLRLRSQRLLSMSGRTNAHKDSASRQAKQEKSGCQTSAKYHHFRND
jgi:hypothetical protein